MTQNNINNKTPQPPLPTREVWWALLLIFNHYQLPQELARVGQDDIPGKVLAAIRLLDCWLDVALREGWMEDK